MVTERERKRRGRAIPTACRLSRRRALFPSRAEAADRGGQAYALRLDMAAAVAQRRDAVVDGDRRGPAGETGTFAADRRAGATWCWAQGAADELSPRRHGRRCRPGVTDVVRGQDLFWATACTGCFRRCSVCRFRDTITIA
jgi:hypothetical protein